MELIHVIVHYHHEDLEMKGSPVGVALFIDGRMHGNSSTLESVMRVVNQMKTKHDHIKVLVTHHPEAPS